MNSIANILGVLGFIVAIVSLIVSLWQYKLHRRQMRTEILAKYCARFNVDKNINAVVKYLEQEDGRNLKYRVKAADDHEAEVFMRYFEELELLIRAHSIDEKVVTYMYFNYVQNFVKKRNYWKNVKYDSEEWKIFHDLFARMKRIRKDNNNYKID